MISSVSRLRLCPFGGIHFLKSDFLKSSVLRLRSCPFREIHFQKSDFLKSSSSAQLPLRGGSIFRSLTSFFLSSQGRTKRPQKGPRFPWRRSRAPKAWTPHICLYIYIYIYWGHLRISNYNEFGKSVDFIWNSLNVQLQLDIRCQNIVK